MRLTEAISAFIRQTERQAARTADTTPRSRSLELLAEYSLDPHISTIEELNAARLNDFLSRWYIEKAISQMSNLPDTDVLFDTLAAFIKWVDKHVREGVEAECLPVIIRLDESLPRALAIYSALSESLAARGGAFGFPEFLTSFEDGGRSLYDIDAPGEAGASEGYFRVLRIVDESAEVEDLITGEQIGPVIFPDEVARLLSPGYIINLEMVRTPSGWQISGCGSVYPPETDI